MRLLACITWITAVLSQPGNTASGGILPISTPVTRINSTIGTLQNFSIPAVTPSFTGTPSSSITQSVSASVTPSTSSSVTPSVSSSVTPSVSSSVTPSASSSVTPSASSSVTPSASASMTSTSLFLPPSPTPSSYSNLTGPVYNSVTSPPILHPGTQGIIAGIIVVGVVSLTALLVQLAKSKKIQETIQLFKKPTASVIVQNPAINLQGYNSRV